MKRFIEGIEREQGLLFPDHLEDFVVEHRLEDKPDAMRIRRSTVEYVFGTLKTWMGHNHFLTRTHKNVATETSLHVLAYNFKRVLNIIGPQNLINAIKVA